MPDVKKVSGLMVTVEWREVLVASLEEHRGKSGGEGMRVAPGAIFVAVVWL